MASDSPSSASATPAAVSDSAQARNAARVTGPAEPSSTRRESRALAAEARGASSTLEKPTSRSGVLRTEAARARTSGDAGARVGVDVDDEYEREGAADMAFAGEGSDATFGIENSSEPVLFSANHGLVATRGVETQPMRVR